MHRLVMRSPGWTGCNRAVSPVIPSNPTGQKLFSSELLKWTQVWEIYHHVLLFIYFFISTSDYLFCRILLAWSISRDVPLHNASSTWQKWLTAWHNMAEVKNKASDMLKEITNNLSPSVQDHPCMCVVNRQRYNGAECQMCPCYIIDDSGKHKVRTGFPHQYPSFVCL